MNTQWTDEIIRQLTELNKHLCLLPAGQLLEPNRLNKVLDLFEQTESLFKFHCECHGFHTKPIPPTDNSNN